MFMEDSGVRVAYSEATEQTEEWQQRDLLYTCGWLPNLHQQCDNQAPSSMQICVFKLLPPRSVSSGICSSAVVSVFFFS